MCTTMIALVRLVIFAAISVGSMFHVSFWQSTTIGMAPARTMAAAQEMIVKLGTMTSSPGPIRRAARATSMATLPLQTATPCAQPISLAKSASSLLTNGPSDEIHPVSMHSIRYFFSLPSSNGRLTGIIRSLLELKFRGKDCFEPRLVHIADVRALLNFDHIKVFQHFEAVSARDQQDHITDAEYAA